MLKLMAWLGVILILLGCVFVGFLAQAGNFDNEPNALENYAADLLCEEGERIQSRSVTRNGSQSSSFYCLNSDGTQTADITAEMTGFIAAGAALPIGLGLLLFITAVVRNQKNVVEMPATQYKAIKMDDLKISDDHRELIQDILGTVVGASQPSKSDLSSRLQQLQDAYEQGLITEDEYAQTRQAVLDAMDDNL